MHSQATIYKSIHSYLFTSTAISSVTIYYYLCISSCPPTPVYSYLSSWNYARVFIYVYLFTSINPSVPTHYSLSISTYYHHLSTGYVYPSTSTFPYPFTTLHLTLPISMCLPNRSIDFYSSTYLLTKYFSIITIVGQRVEVK